MKPDHGKTQRPQLITLLSLAAQLLVLVVTSAQFYLVGLHTIILGNGP
jgi:hypothetical protein